MLLGSEIHFNNPRRREVDRVRLSAHKGKWQAIRAAEILEGNPRP